MKKLLTLTFLLVVGQVYCQDFVKKSDGTYEYGNALSFENNVLKIVNESADTLIFKTEELAIIHISQEGFSMKNLQLQNAQFRSNKYGTTIIFPENNLKSEKKVVKKGTNPLCKSKS
jgi:hypothetical protein